MNERSKIDFFIDRFTNTTFRVIFIGKKFSVPLNIPTVPLILKKQSDIKHLSNRKLLECNSLLATETALCYPQFYLKHQSIDEESFLKVKMTLVFNFLKLTCSTFFIDDIYQSILTSRFSVLTRLDLVYIIYVFSKLGFVQIMDINQGICVKT